MSYTEESMKEFLEELNRHCRGDLECQVSMYEVGATMGLAKGEAGSLAEELMVAGLVELRTLSGGISITREGLTTLGIAPPDTNDTDTTQRFSEGPIANKTDCQLLDHFLDTVKSSISGVKMEYQYLEGIVIDLKTIEVQMLSPSPKIAVFREVLRSLHSAFQAVDNKVVADKCKALIG